MQGLRCVRARFLFVLEGAALLEADAAGVRAELGAGAFAYLPPDTPHRLSSAANAGLLLFERRYALVEAGGRPQARVLDMLPTVLHPHVALWAAICPHRGRWAPTGSVHHSKHACGSRGSGPSSLLVGFATCGWLTRGLTRVHVCLTQATIAARTSPKISIARFAEVGQQVDHTPSHARDAPQRR